MLCALGLSFRKLGRVWVTPQQRGRWFRALNLRGVLEEGWVCKVQSLRSHVLPPKVMALPTKPWGVQRRRRDGTGQVGAEFPVGMQEEEGDWLPYRP